MDEFLMMTTPLPPQYKVVEALGIVTGLTARARGIGGKFIAGLESMAGGEISAYTSEMEKARFEAIERLKQKAKALGANAIIGLDIETSGIFEGIVLVSATATALKIAPVGK